MHEQFMEKESVATQAQILRWLLVSKKFEGSLVIVGYLKEDKRFKGEEKVLKNIANAIKTIGKYRKKDTSVAHRVLQTTIISSSTRKKHLTT